MKNYYWLILSILLLPINSFAQQQQIKKWYLKLEGGYGMGIKAYIYDNKGEIFRYSDFNSDYSKSKNFGIFPGKGIQIGLKVGKKFNSTIGLELGIRYQRCHRYDYSLTDYSTNKNGVITYSGKSISQYYGYAITASPTLVFRKSTFLGVFYTCMGFSMGLGQWVSIHRNEYNNFASSEYQFAFEKQKYMMGFHFGLGIEKPITRKISLCADLRMNNLFYYYRTNRGLINDGYPKEFNKQIPFSNLALNLGLMYHF